MRQLGAALVILQITANVPETEIASLAIGDMATITIEAANKQFQAKLIQINPSSQFTGGQYVIKLNIPAQELKGLLAGMYTSINIEAEKATIKSTTSGSILVPKAALVFKDQLVGVYTISEQNTALLRWLRIGKTQGDQVEVLSGLANNEKYIIKYGR